MKWWVYYKFIEVSFQQILRDKKFKFSYWSTGIICAVLLCAIYTKVCIFLDAAWWVIVLVNAFLLVVIWAYVEASPMFLIQKSINNTWKLLFLLFLAALWCCNFPFKDTDWLAKHLKLGRIECALHSIRGRVLIRYKPMWV